MAKFTRADFEKAAAYFGATRYPDPIARAACRIAARVTEPSEADIERVARAIVGVGVDDAILWEEWGDNNKAAFREEARAALASLSSETD